MLEIKGTQPVKLYLVKAGESATEDYLCAIDANGEVMDAADAAGLKVIGIFFRVDEDGNAEVRDGIFQFANSDANPLLRKNRGAIAYVETGNTVSAVGGDNSVKAGVVVDVDDDGVWLDCRPASIAAAVGANPVAASVDKPVLSADLSGVDTGTDMTVAQATAITNDLAALKASVDGIIDSQKAAGLMA